MAGLTAANRFAGMALGLCKGGLYLVLIAFMVCTVINATENKLPKFNSAVLKIPICSVTSLIFCINDYRKVYQ